MNTFLYIVIGILLLNCGIFIAALIDFFRSERAQSDEKFEHLNDRVTRLERTVEDFKL